MRVSLLIPTGLPPNDLPSKRQNPSTLARELLQGLLHLAILSRFGKEMSSYLYTDLSVSSLPSIHRSCKTLTPVSVGLWAVPAPVIFPNFTSLKGLL